MSEYEGAMKIKLGTLASDAVIELNGEDISGHVSSIVVSQSGGGDPALLVTLQMVALHGDTVEAQGYLVSSEDWEAYQAWKQAQQ